MALLKETNMKPEVSTVLRLSKNEGKRHDYQSGQYY